MTTFKNIILAAAATVVTSLTTVAAVTHELPLPSIPEDMPRAERPDFVVTHFWDSLTPADTALTRNREFMEVNAVNFFYLLPYASADGRAGAYSHVLDRISGDARALSLFQTLAEQYMADPESPLYNEDCYIALLQQLVALPETVPGANARSQFQLEMLSKNRPGSVAADFEFVTRDGTVTSLASTVGRLSILLLYDPECNHCLEAIDTLRGDATVNKLIADRSLDILAVCIEGDTDGWTAVADTLPSSWISGFDRSDIIGNDIYYIQAMPAIYLLAPDRTIHLKNPSPDNLIEKTFLPIFLHE